MFTYALVFKYSRANYAQENKKDFHLFIKLLKILFLLLLLSYSSVKKYFSMIMHLKSFLKGFLISQSMVNH